MKLETKNKACERKCIVTSNSLSKDLLIRFVLSPKGEVTPDIDERLEGRGVWVSANKIAIENALSKNLFNKAFRRKKITANPEISSKVEQLLKQKSLNLISLAKKASALIQGFEKVKLALKKGEVYLLIIADNGKENGIKKLVSSIKEDLPVISCFNSDDVGHTIGKENAVFIAIKKSNIAEKLFAECKRFCRFIEDEQNVHPTITTISNLKIREMEQNLKND